MSTMIETETVRPGDRLTLRDEHGVVGAVVLQVRDQETAITGRPIPSIIVIRRDDSTWDAHLTVDLVASMTVQVERDGDVVARRGPLGSRRRLRQFFAVAD